MESTYKNMETEERFYDPEFVAKIIESRTQFEEGKFKVIEIEDLWK